MRKTGRRPNISLSGAQIKGLQTRESRWSGYDRGVRETGLKRTRHLRETKCQPFAMRNPCRTTKKRTETENEERHAGGVELLADLEVDDHLPCSSRVGRRGEGYKAKGGGERRQLELLSKRPLEIIGTHRCRGS